MEIQEAIKLINENMESDQVKAFLQPIKDQHFSKSLDTWKKNNLPDMIKAATSNEETPEAKRARELQEELDQLKEETSKKQFESEVLAYGMARGLPERLCKGLAIENIETARGLIDDLSGQIRGLKEEAIIKAANGTPPAGGNSTLSTVSLERINDLSADEIYKNLDKLKG